MSITIDASNYYWIEQNGKKYNIEYSSRIETDASKTLKTFTQLTSIVIVNENIAEFDQIQRCKQLDCSHICQINFNQAECSCPPGFEINGYQCKAASNCNDQEFYCDSACLTMISRCDGNQDCDDGSDEANCDACPGEDQFKCSSGECIESYMYCNGQVDCSDHSDEDKCQAKCEANQFACFDRLTCIDSDLQCDGHNDCEDGSDEVCTASPPTRLVVTWSICAAIFIVFAILILFCFFNRPRADQGVIIVQPAGHATTEITIRSTNYHAVRLTKG